MRLPPLVMSVVLACVSAAPATGQTGPFVEVSADLSPVKLAGTNITWQAAHIAGGVQRPGRFGWMGTVDRHQRGPLFDVSFGGSGFRRMGAWTVFGSRVHCHLRAVFA